jgi:hypothetical protein
VRGVLIPRTERGVRTIGIDVKKNLACWMGGRDAVVGGVGVKSGDDERNRRVKTLESSGVGDFGSWSSSEAFFS